MPRRKRASVNRIPHQNTEFMNVFHQLTDLPPFKNTVVTIGSFDGVHAGHQKILRQVSELAHSIEGQSVVVTFEPHPRLVLQPPQPSEGGRSEVKSDELRLLTDIDEKIHYLQQQGIDNVVVVPFTREWSEQSPQAYIEQFLVHHFHPRYIVIGYDHRFGTKRSGDISFLQAQSEQFGYKVIEIQRQEVDALAVSSSKIRKALEAKEVTAATRLLGHYFNFTGEVVKGQQIGREIGFPTANIAVKERYKLVPPHGIYAVFVWIEGVKYHGMLYRGDRPTLKDFDNVTIEVNIFDFKADIYGKKVTVELVDYLRPDQKFESLEDLVVQLAEDEYNSRERLALEERRAYPGVAILILNWNGKHFLEQFLPSVLNAQYPNADVIVADNGSTDGSIDYLVRLNLDGFTYQYGHEKIKIIDLETNFGFAKGYNEAIKRLAETDYEYIVILNSDVRTSMHWLTPLIELMQSDKTIAAAQPKILSYKRKRYFEYAGAAGGWIDRLGYPFSRGRIFDHIEKDRGQYEDVADIFWASGAAMLVRRDLFERFGGFDGNYFAHMEEIDLCWRFKNAGYRVVVEPRGVVRHVGGGTLDYQSPHKTFLNFRNSLFTILKNETDERVHKIIFQRMLLDGVAAAQYLLKGQFRHFRAIWRAHKDFYRQKKNYLEKREQTKQLIEKERIAPPNRAGILPSSIVWQYYVRRRKTFNDLKK